MSGVTIDDHTGEVIDATKQAILRALEIVGGMAEGYAKGLVAPMGPKDNPMPGDIMSALRNSISHSVQGNKVIVGSNLPMAAYVELGTSREYKPPPEWIQSQVEKGKNSGLSHWIFYDTKEQEFKIGLPLPAQPFLQPAIKDHLDEYKEVINTELAEVGK